LRHLVWIIDGPLGADKTPRRGWLRGASTMGRPQVASGADTPHGVDVDAIRWATGVLLGAAADEVTLTIGRRPPPGHRVLWSFAPLPSATRAYVLLPLGSSRAAAATVHGLGNPLARRERYAEAAASALMRTGLAQRAVVPVHLSVPGISTLAPTDAGVFGRLVQVFGRDDLAFGVILGRQRPNRKPVIKVMAPTGEVLGFAKVGWNDLSRSLVREEATVLARIRAAGPATFSVPSPIHAERVGEVELLVSEPLPQAHLLGSGPPLEVPLDATREIAMLAGTHEEPMRTGTYGATMRARVGSGVPLRGELSDALERIDAAWDDAPIDVGTWHGDWIPWNMSRVDGRLYVWDWERAAEGVPVGLDAMHFAFEVALKVRGMAPVDAARHATGSVASMLPSLGADPSVARALMAFHLIEVGLRFRAGADAGMSARPDAYLAALAATVGSVP
jgi:hypothetical protein